MNPLLLAALPTIQAALGRCLDEDPAAQRRLQAMGDNRLLQIQCSGPLGWQLFLRTDLQGPQARLQLQSISAEPAETRISGSPGALLSLLLGDARQQLHQPGITLSGDSELATALQGLINGLDVQREDRLAALFGQLPGHYLENLLAQGSRTLSHSQQRISATLRDYLQEESGLLPHPLQVKSLREQLLQRRLQLDRLEARLALLQQAAAGELTESEQSATN